MKNKTTKKNGLYFDYVKFRGGGYRWLIFNNGDLDLESLFYETLDEAEQNIRSICQILYPHTIENQVVTEAVERFKNENSKV